MYALAFQKVIIEAILDVFYFPFWWYSFGLINAGRWCLGAFSAGNEIMAPMIWLKNIFVPMYGQYDFEGRIISFFMRLVQIIFRALMMLVWLAVCLFLFVIYLAIPVLIFFAFVNIYSGAKLWKL